MCVSEVQMAKRREAWFTASPAATAVLTVSVLANQPRLSAESRGLRPDFPPSDNGKWTIHGFPDNIETPSTATTTLLIEHPSVAVLIGPGLQTTL